MYFRVTGAVSLFMVCAALAITVVPASADTIELTTGQTLQGDVLKESDDAIFVDIGIDVVRIPVQRIKLRTQTTEQPAVGTDEPAAFYATAQLPVRSVDQLTSDLGEGVVLVQTPRGLGSGFLINADGYCVTNYHVIEQETQLAVTIFQRSGERRVHQATDRQRANRRS